MSSDANWVSVTDLHGRPLAVKITQGSSVTNLMPTSLQNLSRFDRDSWANHNRPQSANGDYLTFSQSVPHVTEPDRRTRTGSCGLSDSWNNFDSPFGRSSSVPPTQGGVVLLEHPHGTVKPTDSCSAPFSPYVRRSGECKYPGYHYYPESEAHSVIEEQDEEQGLNPAGCSKDPGERACQLEPEENGGMCIPKATLALRRHRQISEKLSDHTSSSVNPDELSDESSGKHNRSALRILKLPRRRAKSSSDGKSSPATDETEQKQRLKRLKEKACLFLKSNKRGEKFGSRSKQALGGTLKSLAGFTTGILSIDPDAPRRDVVGAHSCPDIHRTRSGHSPTEAFKSFASVSDSSPSGAANSHQFLSDNNHRYQEHDACVIDMRTGEATNYMSEVRLVLPRNLPCPVSDQCPSGSVVRGDEHSKLTFSAPLETFVTSEMPITEEHLKSVPVQDQYAMKRMIVGDTETKVAFGACEATQGANNRQNDSGLEPTIHEPTDTQIILSTDLFSVPPNTDKQEVIPVPETLTNGRESGPHQFIESQKTSIPEPCYKSIERTCRTSLAPDQDQPKSHSTLLPNDQLTNETTSILEPDIPRPGVNAAVTIEPKITTVGQLLETDMNMSVYTDMTEPNSCQSSEVLSAGTRDLFSQSTEPSEKSEGTTEIHYSQLIPYDLDQEVGEGDASLVGIPDISSFVTSAEHRLIGSTDYTSDMVSDASLDFTEIKTDSKTTLSDVGTLDRRTKQFLQSTVPGDCQQLVAEIIEFDSGLDGEVSDTAQWNSEISNASVQLQNPPPVAVKGHSLLVSNCPSLETFPGAFVNANQLKQGVEKNEINSATVTFGSDTEEIRMKASGSIGQTNFVFGEADTSSCDNTEAAASEISRDESITLGERTRKPVEEN
ncbi:hypothetical protein FGIG_02641 [Fasciola gigantica]|uniref:Uncharacterized protein n=1 Tax=Fasciola gigantica TaxID=46835 RepID=A0A504YRA1_FASGI|nr:hypothetical protein FGIG_02641 [Fasciola gigantica]